MVLLVRRRSGRRHGPRRAHRRPDRSRQAGTLGPRAQTHASKRLWPNLRPLGKTARRSRRSQRRPGTSPGIARSGEADHGGNGAQLADCRAARLPRRLAWPCGLFADPDQDAESLRDGCFYSWFREPCADVGPMPDYENVLTDGTSPRGQAKRYRLRPPVGCATERSPLSRFWAENWPR